MERDALAELVAIDALMRAPPGDFRGAFPLAPPPAWWAEAACRGRGLARWFPVDGRRRGAWDEARAICAGCPVKLPCLEAAMTAEAVALVRRDGMVAGLTPRDRDRAAQLGLTAVEALARATPATVAVEGPTAA